MDGALRISEPVTAGSLRHVVLLALLFCAISQAFSATVRENTLDLYTEAADSPVPEVTLPAASRSPTSGTSLTDGIVPGNEQKKSAAIPLPASNTSIASGNWLMLFFLLLMAGIFGLLAEIAITRRQR